MSEQCADIVKSWIKDDYQKKDTKVEYYDFVSTLGELIECNCRLDLFTMPHISSAKIYKMYKHILRNKDLITYVRTHFYEHVLNQFIPSNCCVITEDYVGVIPVYIGCYKQCGQTL